MVSGAIEHERRVSIRSDRAADLGEMHRHNFRIGRGRDDGRRGGALRADGAEDIGPFVSLITRRARARSAFCPDAGQCALLPNAGFVLEPDFERLAFGALGELFRERRGEVFLKASCAASSLFGCCGRTDSRR